MGESMTEFFTPAKSCKLLFFKKIVMDMRDAEVFGKIGEKKKIHVKCIRTSLFVVDLGGLYFNSEKI